MCTQDCQELALMPSKELPGENNSLRYGEAGKNPVKQV